MIGCSAQELRNEDGIVTTPLQGLIVALEATGISLEDTGAPLA